MRLTSKEDDVEIVGVGDDSCVLLGRLIPANAGGKDADETTIQKKEWKRLGLQAVVDAPWEWEVGLKLKDSKTEFEVHKVDEEHFWIGGLLAAKPSMGFGSHKIKKSQWQKLQLDAKLDDAQLVDDDEL